jgi:hypothetical protein
MVSVVIDEVTGARRLQPLDCCDINTAIGILQDTDGMIHFDGRNDTQAAFFNAFAFLIKNMVLQMLAGNLGLDTASKLSRFGGLKLTKKRGKIFRF